MAKSVPPANSTSPPAHSFLSAMFISLSALLSAASCSRDNHLTARFSTSERCGTRCNDSWWLLSTRVQSAAAKALQDSCCTRSNCHSCRAPCCKNQY
jgi:hypothetical protein